MPTCLWPALATAPAPVAGSARLKGDKGISARWESGQSSSGHRRLGCGGLGLTQGDVSWHVLDMATNLKLDDTLIAEAVRIGGHKTKQAAVSAAIAEYVDRRHRLQLLELEGKVEFDPGWDYKKMRRRG